jgi:hypothetical protein
VNIKLYVEGATRRSDFERAICRQAFSEFFAAAGVIHRPRTVPCGGRDATYKDFVTALNGAGPDDLILLLVDSEDAVHPKHTTWQHLKARDGWDKPQGSNDDQAFLMIRVMETWFLADRTALAKFFAKGWNPEALPAWANLESVDKVKVFDALTKASAGCGVRSYAKGNRSFKLLAEISPAVVEAACPAAKRLLDRLRSA